MPTGTSGNDTLYGDGGRDTIDGQAGTDTASYTSFTRGIYANLATGSATPLPRIMPFGDSITYGVVSYSNEESGGYRTKLWDQLRGADLMVDFVGGSTNGPSTLPDRSHQGLRGKTIDYLNQYDATYLSAAKPDVVLLMIGTNDLRTSTASAMIGDLRALIVSITDNQPNAAIFVSTIPPVHNATQNSIATAYNNAIPGLVAELDDTRKVKFVDMRDLTLSDVTAPPADSGVHPTSAGYAKIADHWFDALAAAGVFENDRDTLISIENLTGTARQDRLVGSDGSNVLNGLAGNDELFGGLGDDRLEGGSGNDVLNGGAGSDRMLGGIGDDIYYVDSSGDIVIENPGEGTDTVRSTIASYTLTSDVNILYLDGSQALNGTGNASPNTMNGNGLSNQLLGLDGDDKLYGNGGNDRLEGGAGDDFLKGHAGTDTYVGGTGADSFDWNTIAEAGKGSTRDVVLDFARGEDKIDLSGIDARTNASGNNSFTFIGSAAFGGTSGELRYQTFDGSTADYTLIQGDVNGDRIADFEIMLQGQKTELTATDFYL